MVLNYFNALINKKGAIFQKRTEIFPYYINTPLNAKNVEWIPLEGDSVRIVMPDMFNQRRSKTIHLPDY